MRIRRRHMGNALIWLVLAASLAGCASGSSASSTSTAPLATASPPGSFVCANSRGASQLYAYVGPDQRLYVVRGCATPVVIAAPAGHQLAPVSFSSNGTWLLAWNNDPDTQSLTAQNCLALIDLRSMQLAQTTTFCNPSGSNGPHWQTWYDLIEWTSDSSFYLSATSAKDNSVTVTYVTVPGLAPIPVTTVAWVANLAHRPTQGDPLGGFTLRAGALYYGGYRSTSEGGAWLHRFLLGTQADSRVVRLGVAGKSGCQVNGAPCAWTGPWDISSDGSQIVYHNPGPTQSVTDTATKADTPLYLAPTAGGQATRLFPATPLGQGFSAPAFSPDDAYVAAMLGDRLMIERLADGAVRSAPAGLRWQCWTPQAEVALVTNDKLASAPDHAARFELYNVKTGALTPLQPGAYDYVWQ